MWIEVICIDNKKVIECGVFFSVQFDVVDSSGLVIPVSLWMKKLTSDENPKCLVVMEPVERTAGKIVFDITVKILR